jgi:hypothetical protein
MRTKETKEIEVTGDAVHWWCCPLRTVRRPRQQCSSRACLENHHCFWCVCVCVYVYVYIYINKNTPNVVIEWLVLLLRIWKVTGSNIASESWLRFCGFPQSFQANARIVPEMRPRPLPSISFPIHYSLIILSFEILSASSSKPLLMSCPPTMDHFYITTVIQQCLMVL